MALYPDYISEAEVKSAITDTEGYTADDAELGFAISAASRAIDHYCNRQFGLADSATARYFKAYREGCDYRAPIFDLMTTDGLVVKTGTGDGTFPTTLTLNEDFRLEPLNAAADSKPWTSIVGNLPTSANTIEVTAKWGWSAVPAVVKQACLGQTLRLFYRKDAPLGVAGSPEVGSEMRLLARLDPDVQMLLSTVKRHYGGV